MNALFQKTLFHLTGKTDVDSSALSELEQLVKEHPYFSPAQLMLTKKLKETNDPSYFNKLHQLALYFPNTSWLQYLLNSQSPAKDAIDEVLNTAAFMPATSQTAIIEPSNDTPAAPVFHMPVPEPSIAAPVQETIAATAPEPDYSWQAPEHTPQVETPTTSITKISIHEEVPVFDPYPSFEEETPAAPAPSVVPDQGGMVIPTIEDVKQLLDQRFQTTDTAKANNIADLPSYEAPRFTENSFKEEIPFPAALTVDAEESAKEKIKSILAGQVAEFNKPVTEEDVLPISTEPFHTVDYFASQGIKIDLTKIPQDKLTVQLRKFTDWLKYMRKVSPSPTDLGTDPAQESKVQTIAQHSNEAKEVLTEAMAEVLEKQGQPEKAIQIYIKLSFLYPEKSAYFAAKIQQLKGI